MRFYKRRPLIELREYLRSINVPEGDCNLIGNKIDALQIKAYQDYFKTIEKKMPKNVLEIYNEEGYFHDAKIKNISVSNLGLDESTVQIVLHGVSACKTYNMIFNGVFAMKMDIPSKPKEFEKYDRLYELAVCHFELLEKKKWKVSFYLVDFGEPMEMEFCCTSFDIETIET